LRIRLVDFEGKVLSDKSTDIDIPAQSSAIYSTQTEQEILGTADPRNVVAVYDLSASGQRLSHNEVFFAKMRDLNLPSPNVEVKVGTENDKGPVTTITLKSATFARNVALFFGDLDVQATDNYFDILPGTQVTVAVRGKATAEEVRKALKVVTIVDAERDSGKTNVAMAQ
jgi:beta-mannosidase